MAVHKFCVAVQFGGRPYPLVTKLLTVAFLIVAGALRLQDTVVV